MARMKRKNYPLYETTVFRDFRVMMENTAARNPDGVAISYKNAPNDKVVQKITYAQVKRDVRALGEAMMDMGLSGKKVMISGKNSWEWIYCYFALMSIGAVTVPTDKDLPEEELLGIVNRAGCAAVCYGGEISQKANYLRENMPEGTLFIAMGEDGVEGDISVSALIEKGHALLEGGSTLYDSYEVKPDELATIVFTSGTTGKGKGVMLSITNIVSDMTQGMYLFDITPKTMMVLPAHHTFGSTVNIVGHYAQCSEIYISSGIKYFVREIQEQQPSHVILVPLFLETLHKKIWQGAEKKGKADTMRKGMKISKFLLKLGIDVRRKLFAEVHHTLGGKLEMVISGGAPLRQDIIEDFQAWGLNVLNGYGITECAPLISCNRNLYQKQGSVGMPIIGGQVKILEPDEDGDGEICYKGPNVMLGYYDEPEATAAVFDDEGYFRTGDYGHVVRNGDECWIYITGRKKNMILFSNGKNVYPEEIEVELAQRIDGISEVIVYAGECVDHPEKEIIVAEIFPDAERLEALGITDVEGYFAEKVKEVNDYLISYKHIGHVKIRHEEFEKNTSKKILRFKIDKRV